MSFYQKCLLYQKLDKRMNQLNNQLYCLQLHTKHCYDYKLRLLSYSYFEEVEKVCELKWLVKKEDITLKFEKYQLLLHWQYVQKLQLQTSNFYFYWPCFLCSKKNNFVYHPTRKQKRACLQKHSQTNRNVIRNPLIYFLFESWQLNMKIYYYDWFPEEVFLDTCFFLL